MAIDVRQFDEAYYELATKSCYFQYAWLPEQTCAACHAMCLQLPIGIEETIIDVGAAKGFYLAAFRSMLHRMAWGVDVSQYCLDNCHPAARGYLAHSLDGRSIVWPGPFSVAIAKDILEHCDEEETLPALLEDIARKCERLFVVVPLADESGRYVARAEERDATHLLRKTGRWWEAKIREYYQDVSMTHVFPGLKQQWQFVPGAHGFLVARRGKFS